MKAITYVRVSTKLQKYDRQSSEIKEWCKNNQVDIIEEFEEKESGIKNDRPVLVDAILDFPDKIVRNPEDYKLPLLKSPESVKKSLEELLNHKLSELSITYIRTNGTEQKLTLPEILKRKEAFEMAYNPNDGIEIRWGAPEGSEERSSCKRRVPANQLARMNSVRSWFNKRLHPPT